MTKQKLETHDVVVFNNPTKSLAGFQELFHGEIGFIMPVKTWIPTKTIDGTIYKVKLNMPIYDVVYELNVLDTEMTKIGVL